MIPYFVFGGVTYTYWVLIERRFRADLSVSTLKPLLGLFWGSGSDNLTFNAALWFLPCLFVVSCIFVLILNIIKKRKLMICSFVFLALLGIIIGRYSPIRLPWGVDISLFMIIFYTIGYYSYDFISDKIFNTSYNNKIIIGIICLAITGVIGIINKGVAVASVQYGNELLFITTSMSGTLLIVTIAQIIGKNKIIETFGKSSLIIMGIHEPIRRIILKVISVIIKIGVDEIRVNVLYSIIVCLITSIISLIISIIINKIIPWPIGAYKLKRETVDA